MTQASLEARVAQLEQQVAELLKRAGGRANLEPGRDDWKKTIGMFDGDPVAKEIINEALKIREEDRKRTRP